MIYYTRSYHRLYIRMMSHAHIRYRVKTWSLHVSHFSTCTYNRLIESVHVYIYHIHASPTCIVHSQIRLGDRVHLCTLFCVFLCNNGIHGYVFRCVCHCKKQSSGSSEWHSQSEHSWQNQLVFICSWSVCSGRCCLSSFWLDLTLH